MVEFVGKQLLVEFATKYLLDPPRDSGTLKSWGGLRAVTTAWAMTAGSSRFPGRSNHAVQTKHEQPDKDLKPSPLWIGGHEKNTSNICYCVS